MAEALEAVLSDNTQRVYGAQWRIFTGWCGEMGLSSLPAEPLTVARYLAARAGSGASIATMRLAASAISKAHEWAKLESPCRDPGVRASLTPNPPKGYGAGIDTGDDGYGKANRPGLIPTDGVEGSARWPRWRQGGVARWRK